MGYNLNRRVKVNSIEKGHLNNDIVVVHVDISTNFLAHLPLRVKLKFNYPPLEYGLD